MVSEGNRQSAIGNRHKSSGLATPTVYVLRTGGVYDNRQISGEKAEQLAIDEPPPLDCRLPTCLLASLSRC